MYYRAVQHVIEETNCKSTSRGEAEGSLSLIIKFKTVSSTAARMVRRPSIVIIVDSYNELRNGKNTLLKNKASDHQ